MVNEAIIQGTGQQLYLRAKTLIPGGTQLLSKRPELFAPGLWPAYYSKAKGAKVWDLDGREYHGYVNYGGWRVYLRLR